MNNNSSSPQKEKPILINSSSNNAGGNVHHIVLEEEQKKLCKNVVRYKECLKNHAAAIGGSATDGCGEFMPSGEEGTIEALKCSACNCHKNFHRKERECECGCECQSDHYNFECYPYRNQNVGLQEPPPHPQMMILSNKSGSARSESDDGGGPGGADQKMRIMRKRFRTKFTHEQKEKMLSFAERAGWRIQKLEESVVQNFCQEIGIQRKVLKVWMHNNKHTFAKKNSIH